MWGESQTRDDQVGVHGSRLGQAHPELANALLDLVWDSADIVALTWLDERGIIDVNDAFEDYFGVARADARGGNGLKLNLWQDMEERAAIINAVTLGVPLNGMPVRLRTPAGEHWIGHAWAARCMLPGGPAAVFVFKSATESVRTEQMLALQRTAAELLSDGTTGEAETATRLMAEFGGRLGWTVGAYWRPDGDDELLRCHALWRSQSAVAPGFAALTRSLVLTRGQELPGLVWRQREPLWRHVIPGSSRATAATRDGLRTGVGFPVAHGREVTGVFELYCHHLEPVDDALRETAEALGRQFGLFLRVRARAADGGP